MPRASPTSVLGELAPAALQVGARVGADALDDPLVLQNTDVTNRNGTRHWMPGIRVAVVKLTALFDEDLGYAVSNHDTAQGLIARSDALRHSHKVGTEPEVLVPEPMPEAPETADHLIGD
jgi:hypothetical protein